MSRSWSETPPRTERPMTHPMEKQKQSAWLLHALADFECAHGKLPTDKNIRCKCWKDT